MLLSKIFRKRHCKNRTAQKLSLCKILIQIGSWSILDCLEDYDEACTFTSRMYLIGTEKIVPVPTKECMTMRALVVVVLVDC